MTPVKPLILALMFTVGAVAATPAIGIVTASGHFTVQGSQVWGNATLFQGAIVETSEASSQVTLRDGVKVQLAAGSKARVYADHLTLERGAGQVAQAKAFEVDAGDLKIRGAGVQVGLGETVEVASFGGTASVLGERNKVLASVRAGQHMSFAPQQAGNVSTTGCLLYKDNHFIIQDQGPNMVVSELNGDPKVIQPNLGNRVTVNGTLSTASPAVTVATRVINVSAVSPNAQGGCLVAAAALQARTDMPAGAAAQTTPTPNTGNAPAAAKSSGGGLSTGAKTAIWVAVIGGGAGGAVFALEANKKSTSP